MNIAFLNGAYKSDPSSGGNAHIRQFIEHVIEQKHDVWSFGNVKRESTSVFSDFLLTRIRQATMIDCCYHRLEGEIPFSVRWCGGRIKHFLRRSSQVWEWNTVPEYKDPTGELRAVFGRYANTPDLNICVTSELEDYVKSLGFHNTLVVPNGSDPKVFAQGVPTCKTILGFKGCINIVWIGSAGIGWHDFLTILECARILDSRNSRVKFHIIGAGIHDLDCAPRNVHYHGSVSYSKLPSWLSGMDIGLIAYKSGPAMYGSPLKLFDYMSSALPIVSTEHPQVRQILSEAKQSEFVVDTNDSQGMADSIQTLCNEFDRKKIGRDLRALLVEKYTWKHNVTTIVEAISNLRKNKG